MTGYLGSSKMIPILPDQQNRRIEAITLRSPTTPADRLLQTSELNERSALRMSVPNACDRLAHRRQYSVRDGTAKLFGSVGRPRFIASFWGKIPCGFFPFYLLQS